MTRSQDNGVPIYCLKTSNIHSDKSKEQTDVDFRNYNSELFSKFWRDITSDNHLTLFGFRRYRTTHLLNLRFLEAEIHKIDHALYQAGLQMEQPLGCDHTLDRLGLRKAKIDDEQVKAEQLLNENLIIRLRRLIREYGGHLSTRS